MNARYYDPETGRFISQDTYRGTGEAFWHLYLYCDSDPVNNIDPTGHNPGELFNTMDIAARDAALYINAKSISQNREYATAIYEVKTKIKKLSYYKTHRFLWWTWKTPVYTTTIKIQYSYKKLIKGQPAGVATPRAPINKKRVAIFHTHAAYMSDVPGDQFSSADKSLSDKLKIPIYVATSLGTLRKYDPSDKSDVILFRDMPFDPNHPYRRS